MTFFEAWAQQHKVSLTVLFPTVTFQNITIPNMSVTGNFFGNNVEHEDLQMAEKRMQDFTNKHPKSLLANGYLEERAFYNTKNYRSEGEEPRNIHLGTDFWLPAATPICTPFDGTIVVSHDNNLHKDYGPTLIVAHTFGNLSFYTLYGHLSRKSLDLSPKGKIVKKGEIIGYLGDAEENGNWVPHLHFQLITDLLGNTKNFNGTAKKSEIERWKKLCPNPNLIFIEAF